MEIVSFWFLLCICVGFFAARFGRSGIFYFLISLVLSPLFGLIVILCLGHAFKCPKCMGGIRKGARYCRHCSSEIEP